MKQECLKWKNLPFLYSLSSHNGGGKERKKREDSKVTHMANTIVAGGPARNLSFHRSPQSSPLKPSVDTTDVTLRGKPPEPYSLRNTPVPQLTILREEDSIPDATAGL